MFLSRKLDSCTVVKQVPLTVAAKPITMSKALFMKDMKESNMHIQVKKAWTEIKETALSLQGSFARLIYCTHLGTRRARPAVVRAQINPDIDIVARHRMHRFQCPLSHRGLKSWITLTRRKMNTRPSIKSKINAVLTLFRKDWWVYTAADHRRGWSEGFAD